MTACDQNAAGARLGLSLAELGIARMSLGKHAEAADLIRRGIAILESSPGAPRKTLSDLLQALGSAYFYQHRLSDAERAYRKSLDIMNETAAPEPAAMISLLSDLGAVYQAQGRYSDARASLERARDWPDRSAHSDPILQATLLTISAASTKFEARHEDAVRSYRVAIELLSSGQDIDGVLTATVMNDLALECMRLKQYGEAATILARAVANVEKGTLLPRRDVARLLRNYRACLEKQGKRIEVKKLDSRAKVILGFASAEASDARTIDVSELRNRK